METFRLGVRFLGRGEVGHLSHIWVDVNEVWVADFGVGDIFTGMGVGNFSVRAMVPDRAKITPLPWMGGEGRFWFRCRLRWHRRFYHVPPIAFCNEDSEMVGSNFSAVFVADCFQHGISTGELDEGISQFAFGSKFLWDEKVCYVSITCKNFPHVRDGGVEGKIVHETCLG